jgi:hypothetical protein
MSGGGGGGGNYYFFFLGQGGVVGGLEHNGTRAIMRGLGLTGGVTGDNWRVTPGGEGNWVPYVGLGIALGVGFIVEGRRVGIGWEMVAERQSGVAAGEGGK